jgi:hypothetical protein
MAKVSKPKISRRRKDPQGENTKPTFTNAGKSQTMKVERPKTSGFKLPKKHPHSSKAVKRTKRAK